MRTRLAATIVATFGLLALGGFPARAAGLSITLVAPPDGETVEVEPTSTAVRIAVRYTVDARDCEFGASDLETDLPDTPSGYDWFPIVGAEAEWDSAGRVAVDAAIVLEPEAVDLLPRSLRWRVTAACGETDESVESEWRTLAIVLPATPPPTPTPSPSPPPTPGAPPPGSAPTSPPPAENPVVPPSSPTAPQAPRASSPLDVLAAALATSTAERRRETAFLVATGVRCGLLAALERLCLRVFGAAAAYGDAQQRRAAELGRLPPVRTYRRSIVPALPRAVPLFVPARARPEAIDTLGAIFTSQRRVAGAAGVLAALVARAEAAAAAGDAPWQRRLGLAAARRADALAAGYADEPELRRAEIRSLRGARVVPPALDLAAARRLRSRLARNGLPQPFADAVRDVGDAAALARMRRAVLGGDPAELVGPLARQLLAPRRRAAILEAAAALRAFARALRADPLALTPTP